MKLSAILAAVISMVCVFASAAGAADRIYWTNYNGAATVSVANLDGTGAGQDLFTATAPRGGTVSAPTGLALDPAAGLIYWSNTNNRISRGSLDSCDPAATCATDLYPLLAGGPPVGAPGGLALDTAHGLMYWMNTDGSLVRTSLDGSGAVNELVNTTGAAGMGGGGSGGVAIDPRTGRIYWSSDDFGPGSISWANLDGSGGGDVVTSGANMGRPWGLALDLPGNRVYWASYNGATDNKGSISWASLDGSGGGDLYTAASPGCGTLNGPNGVAIDRAANKIYWANFAGSSLGSANLDGTGGCTDIGSAGATMNGPDEVALLKAPAADAAPTLGGALVTGKPLTCGQGTWGPNQPEASLFRVPRSFTYEWRRNSAPVAGASAAAFSPKSSGSYTCIATATNNAGSTASKTSAAVTVKLSVRFAAPKFKRKLAGNTLLLTGRISPKASPAVAKRDCAGSLALKVELKKKRIASKRFALKYKNKKCSAAVSLKIAKKYAGKKAKLTISIGRSAKLAATPKTASIRL